MKESTIEDLCVNTIRTLSMDAVQQANSGHPGTPMALAPIAYTLWQDVLRYDPAQPTWPNRDRFILSNGHASMLLYSILHLCNVQQMDDNDVVTDKPAVSLEDIKRFRQLDSRCPGHPEYHHTTGVEVTTGPLGQGVGNSVGIAMAQAWLASTFNKPDFPLFDFRVYAFCGDGDMMEGISSEAASLAGHLKLANLVWIYDNNRITIEGKTSLAFSEDVGLRFKAYGWYVLHVTDANDRATFAAALASAQKVSDRPTLIIVDSHIGYGAPKKQDTKEAHGEPLGDEEIRGAKKAYGWPEDAKFLVPDGVREHFANGIGKRGAEQFKAWRKLCDQYKAKYPELAAQLEAMRTRDLPSGWDKDMPTFPADAKGVATRDSSGKVLNAVAKNVPWLIGGAADLAPSTKTLLAGTTDFEAKSHEGRNLHFGIREHAMGAIVNGLAVSKFRPFGATFLIFSSYMRAPIRLAALMQIPSVFIFTHDSIGVGEDGPTHQPIEQLASLRAIPRLVTLRPADANEVVESWRVIMGLKHEAVALALTRQALPTVDRTKYGSAKGVAKGAYVLADAPGAKPDVILIATGSEVYLCMEAYEKLTAENIKARVVSMPSWELFERQPKEYQESVIPPAITARVCVEQASNMGWDRYAGPRGEIIAMRTFGASAPLKDLQKTFGFTSENIIKAAKNQLAQRRS